MTTEQEKKVIAQAQAILERRAAIDNKLALNANSVAYYGAYYLGAIQAVQDVVGQLLTNKPKGDDWIYQQAFYKLITSSKRNMQLYLDGTEMRYRNHEHNKKGKLVSVECYFVERISIIKEKQ